MAATTVTATAGLTLVRDWPPTGQRLRKKTVFAQLGHRMCPTESVDIKSQRRCVGKASLAGPSSRRWPAPRSHC